MPCLPFAFLWLLIRKGPSSISHAKPQSNLNIAGCNPLTSTGTTGCTVEMAVGSYCIHHPLQLPQYLWIELMND